MFLYFRCLRDTRSYSNMIQHSQHLQNMNYSFPPSNLMVCNWSWKLLFRNNHGCGCDHILYVLQTPDTRSNRMLTRHFSFTAFFKAFLKHFNGPWFQTLEKRITAPSKPFDSCQQRVSKQNKCLVKMKVKIKMKRNVSHVHLEKQVIDSKCKGKTPPVATSSFYYKEADWSTHILAGNTALAQVICSQWSAVRSHGSLISDRICMKPFYRYYGKVKKPADKTNRLSDHLQYWWLWLFYFQEPEISQLRGLGVILLECGTW